MNPLRATAWWVAACALMLWGCPGKDNPHPDGGEPDSGTPTASLSLSDAPAYDFGTRPVGLTVERAFTLANSGDGSATSLGVGALAAPFAFKGGGYPGAGGSCGNTLAPGATCTVVVTFTPTRAGSAASSLALSYNDGTGPRTVSIALQGTGATPAALALSDGPVYDYGTTATGSALDHAFTLTNHGGFTASAVAPGSGLTGPFNFKDGAYPGTGGTCASTLAAGASCTVVVTFAPTSSGPVTAKLVIAYSDGAAQQSVSVDVKGDANTPADLSISDGAAYDYGTRALSSSTDHTFTVSNSGGLPATNLSASGLAAPFAFKGGSYPGTGGTCGATLASLATCTLVITYAPSTPGTSTATLSLAFVDGANPRTITRGLRGDAISPASLSISDAPAYDFGTQALGSSTDHAFTLTNTGGVTATSLTDAAMLTGPFAFRGGYPGTGGTCASTLAVGASCTLVVTFSPSASGNFSSTVGVFYFDGATARTVSRNVTGRGTAQAFLVLSDTPLYDFGVHATGSATDHTFTVTNTGAQVAVSMAGGALAVPFSFKGGAYPGSGGSCGATLAAGANCTVVVTFAPTAQGVSTGTLGVTYNDGASNQTATVGLRGSGTAVAALSISDAPAYDFGTRAVGSATDHTFTVTNTGAGDTTALSAGALAAPFAFKGGAYPGSGGSCASSLTAGSSCTVVVTFAPTATGAANATLSLSYNDGLASQTASRALTGAGAAAALLSISDGPSYDFGAQAVGSSTAHSFTVNNAGGVNATGLSATSPSAPFSFSGGSYPGAGGTCGATLAPADSCTIVVVFAPTATGTASDSLALTYNDGVTSQTASRPLTGTGAAPALVTVSDAPGYDFGTQAIGSTSEHTFTLSNTGGVPATGFSAVALAAPFAFKGGSYPGTGGTCATGLVPSAACTVVVTFSPTAAGAASGTLSVGYSDGAASQTASRALAGTGASPASLSFSGYDFGTHPVGSTTDQAITVSNTGGASATGISAGALAAPFSFKGGSYPGTGGTCGTSLPGGATCTVILTFAPTTTGNASAILTLNWFDGALGQGTSAPITGSAILPAQLTLSGGSLYDFGTVGVGGAVDRIEVVTNVGAGDAMAIGPAALPAPFSFKGGSYPGIGGDCGFSLASGARCILVLTFAPSATGLATATLSLSYNDGGSAQSATQTLRGAGTNAAALTLTDWPPLYYSNYGLPPDGPTFDYGQQAIGGAADHTFVVTNTGAATATGLAGVAPSTPFSFKGGSYPGVGGTCGASLAPNESCTLAVTFAPTAAVSSSSTLGISWAAGAGTQTVTRSLTGAGTSRAVLTLNDFNGVSIGPAYDFGTSSIGNPLRHTFVVQNTGAQTATGLSGAALATPFSYDGGAYPGSGGSCGSSLAAGDTCFVVVAFLPTAAGRATGTLSLSYNDGASNQSVTRALQGGGTNLALLSIGSQQGGGGVFFDYGTHGIGSATDQVFTVSNLGAQAATALAPATLPAPFSYKGGGYPGTGGSCASSLAAGASCTVVVTFAPTLIGASSASLSISYGDGAGTSTATRGLTGAGTAQALLSIRDWQGGNNGNSPFDYGISGVPVDHTFYVSNSGAQDATSMTGGAMPAGFTFKGGSYPGVGGSCAVSLAPGGTCTVVVTFSPSGNTSAGGPFNIAYNDGAGSRTVSRAVVGTGTTLALLAVMDCNGCGVDSQPADFGTAGSPTDRTFYVVNIGAQSATALADGGTLGNGFAFKGGAFPGTGGSCAGSLASGSSCTVVVTFTPSGSGPRSSTLTVGYFDGGSTRFASRALTGTATTLAVLGISSFQGCTLCASDPNPFDYGTSGVPVDHTFYLVNTGAQSATSISDGGTLGGGFGFKGGSYPGSGGTCGTSLASGATCTVVVTFAPSGDGPRSSTLTLQYNDGASARSASRAFTGTATTLAVVSVSEFPGCSNCTGPSPFDYGTSGVPVDRTFYVTNTGAQAATALGDGGTLGGGFGFKGGSYPGTNGSCGTTLNSGATCTVVVTFTPSGNGTLSSTLTLGYNDGSATRGASRALTGTATTLALLGVSDFSGCCNAPGPYDYGTSGIPVDHTFFLVNNGGQAAVAIGDGLTLGGDFGFKGGSYPGTGGTCGTSLGSGNSCVLVVTFSPSGSGARSSTLTVGYNNGAGTSSVSRALAGTATDRAYVVVRDSGGFTDAYGPYDFGTVSAFGGFADATFTVFNSGALTASASDAGTLSSPFQYVGGTYPGLGGTCGSTLAPGASCTIQLRFAPTFPGTFNGNLGLSISDGFGPVQSADRALRGTGQ